MDWRHEPTLSSSPPDRSEHRPCPLVDLGPCPPLKVFRLVFFVHQPCQLIHRSLSSHSNNSARHSSTGLIHDLPILDELFPGLARNSDKILSRDEVLS